MPHRALCSAPAALILLVALTSRTAAAEDLPQIADAYLQSIRAENWTEMASLLASEARYQDFSMEYFDRPMIDLSGPEAIVAFWRESAAGAGTIEVRWDFDERFVAGPNLFLIGQTYVRNQGAAWGFPGHELETRFPQITHLRIVDGKVVYHADHVDYDDAGRQLRRQSEAIVAKEGRGELLRWSHPIPESEIRTTAEAYLAAIEAFDWTKMATFLDDSSQYQDFSLEHTGSEMLDLEGAEAIVEVWSSGVEASGILAIQLDAEKSFVAGPNLFTLGWADFRMKGDAAGIPGSELEMRVRHILHLRIVDGKVTYHADHVDYAAMMQQIEEKKAALYPGG